MLVNIHQSLYAYLCVSIPCACHYISVNLYASPCIHPCLTFSHTGQHSEQRQEALQPTEARLLVVRPLRGELLLARSPVVVQRPGHGGEGATTPEGSLLARSGERRLYEPVWREGRCGTDGVTLYTEGMSY